MLIIQQQHKLGGLTEFCDEKTTSAIRNMVQNFRVTRNCQKTWIFVGGFLKKLKSQ
jgi:hypothetical protein